MLNRATPSPHRQRQAHRWSAIALCVLAASAAHGRPPVIDVHVHTDPSRFAIALDILGANGVSRFVNLSGGPAGSAELARSLDAARDHEGRVKICANVDWSRLESPNFGEMQAQRLTEAASAGAACLKISKALGLFVADPTAPGKLLAVDDPRLDPIWAAAGRLGLPVMWHTGDPKAFFAPATPSNERWAELKVHPTWSFADPKYPRREALLAARDRVLARHRKTTFVGVHFANNSEDLDYVAQALTDHPNLYVDVAARLPEIGRHPPAKVKALFERFADRILFGTDLGLGRGIMLGSTGTNRPTMPDIDLFYHDHYRWFETATRQIPHPTPIQGDWRIDGVALPSAVLHKVYYLNAMKLFWKSGPSQAMDEAFIEAAPDYAELHSF
ncbi:MAG: amidohydrolase family protein [Bradymonadia bacterium]